MATVATDAGAQPTPSLSAEQVLSTTRTVRKRLDFSRAVPTELIEECLRVAQQAPIGSNALHPHFVIVTDPAKRAALGSLYKRAWEGYLPMPFSVPNIPIADPRHAAQQPRVVDSAAYLAEHLAEVPALVIPCISPRPDGQPTWIAACIWGSVLPAAWSFMLAARARGLASAWTQIHPMFEEESAAILGISYPHVVQAAMLAVAFPRGGADFNAVYREPLAQYLHYDGW
jgi:nitroreductase